MGILSISAQKHFHGRGDVILEIVKIQNMGHIILLIDRDISLAVAYQQEFI